VEALAAPAGSVNVGIGGVMHLGLGCYVTVRSVESLRCDGMRCADLYYTGGWERDV
jgi:hypothetical protein